MTRNLRHRVEIAAPVYDEDIREMILRILQTQLSDTAKASLLQPDGSYVRKNKAGTALIDSQQAFMDESLHKQVVIKPVKKDLKHFLRDLLLRNRK